MICRMCGYEFDPEESRKMCDYAKCSGCDECNSVMCPNCGYSNHLEFEQEFEFIEKLKGKIKDKMAAK